MPAKRELTMRQMRHVLRHQASGVSAREIGRTIGIGRSTVQDALKRAQAAGMTWPLPRVRAASGRTRRRARLQDGHCRSQPVALGRCERPGHQVHHREFLFFACQFRPSAGADSNARPPPSEATIALRRQSRNSSLDQSQELGVACPRNQRFLRRRSGRGAVCVLDPVSPRSGVAPSRNQRYRRFRIFGGAGPIPQGSGVAPPRKQISC